jgi:hypothetical protein
MTTATEMMAMMAVLGKAMQLRLALRLGRGLVL